MIATARLSLVPASVASLVADLAGRRSLAEVLQAHVPPSWPPELYDGDAIRWSLDRLRAAPLPSAGFSIYYIVWRDAADGPVAVGVGGFKGPPVEGRVELGYSVLASYRRLGFATETVRGLLDFAFSTRGVEEVIAETLPGLAPSIGVLEKTGFLLSGPGSEEGVIRYGLSRANFGEPSLNEFQRLEGLP